MPERVAHELRRMSGQPTTRGDDPVAGVADFEAWDAAEGEHRVIHSDATGWRERLRGLAADLRT